MPVGARPRGIVLSQDGRFLYICTSDADHIEVLDLASLTVTRTLPSNPDPEYMALSADGTTLYVANEDNSQVSVLDVTRAVSPRKYRSVSNRKAWRSAPTTRRSLCTSETTSMAHFIDVATHQVVASVLVGTRPRFAVFSKDGSRVWVSSEVAGTVAVIDTATHKMLHDHPLRPARGADGRDPGRRHQPDRRWQYGLCRSGPGQPRGGDRPAVSR